jgi:AraC-like DNA-binding protein
MNEEIMLFDEFSFKAKQRMHTAENLSTFHWDYEVEIVCMLSGSGIVSINESDYHAKPGDIYIINSCEYHRIYTDGRMEYIIISFDPGFVHFLFSSSKSGICSKMHEPSLLYSSCIPSEHFLSKSISCIIQKISEEFSHESTAYKQIISAYLAEMLALLYRHTKNESPYRKPAASNRSNPGRIMEAITYINNNYPSKISLSEIAQKAYMEPSYFSAYFKKITNTNISDYIKSLRLKHATHLLIYSSKKITEISMESGFQSISSFNQCFKEATKLAPREFRERYKV